LKEKILVGFVKHIWNLIWYVLKVRNASILGVVYSLLSILKEKVSVGFVKHIWNLIW
jgi:hypothetical protein